jgi:hypothetical protein
MYRSHYQHTLLQVSGLSLGWGTVYRKKLGKKKRNPYCVHVMKQKYPSYEHLRAEMAQ